jgi:osmotically-inducible protein OsmY
MLVGGFSEMSHSVALLEGPRLSQLGDRVRRRLNQSSYHAVRQVKVEERQGVLTLSGRMPTFFLKQMAQTAAASVEGVHRIINRIEVVEPAY